MEGIIRDALRSAGGAFAPLYRAFGWVHRAVHILGQVELAGAVVRSQLSGLRGAMTRHRGGAVGKLGSAVDQFVKVSRSYRPGLFGCDDTVVRPRTNNDLEWTFGSHRHHERRATGRKAASPSLVLRGAAKLVAGLATRSREVTAADQHGPGRAAWKQRRADLETRRERRRFRRGPDGYLPEKPRKQAHPARFAGLEKTLAEHVATQRAFLGTQLRPCLDAAVAGREHVRFVNKSHCVYRTYLCCLWPITQPPTRSSATQRTGAWNAVTRTVVLVTDTTVVNTDTMCELPRKMAAVLSITLLYLPGYSPNLNLIERLWRFLKRKSVYGKYYPNFATFRAAIKDTLSELNTTHAEPLAALMALQFQEFEDVSLLTE
ncbi:hypothetical protein GobsT_26870 [Gemmata obscuriglobus]|uniref:Tc1-like transposase DDE domain-containing protein n=3 Tax=Gemmata obscuriglobus TaxID=114 RepID=A0A2Z3GZ51_9BACT|nr:transposase [Gemmata obscuriglobus]AWM39043.1 hypothetical protein C1280_20035 [Gemmata obscuriglobus]QEG27923.1 hypothetical protein GobsT_26870 [Gemmata obscuriglobus]